MIELQIMIQGIVVLMIMMVIWWGISSMLQIVRAPLPMGEPYRPTLPDQTYDQIIAAQEVYEVIATSLETPCRPEEAPPERR